MIDYLTATSGSTALWPLVGIVVTSFFTALGIWFKYGPDRRRADTESDASLRTSLLKRIDKLEADQVSDRTTYELERRKDREECEKTTDELRQRIREQDKLIDGLQRQLIMFQVASGRALPLGAKSPELEAMMVNLAPLFGVSEESEALKSARETKHAAEVTVEQIQQDEAGA